MRQRPLSSTFVPASATIAFSGVVDEEVVALFRRQVEQARVGAEGLLRIDLSDVDYFPSTALDEIVQLMKSAPGSGTGIGVGVTPGAAVEVVSTKGSIAQRVLAMAGIPHHEQ